MSIVTALAKQNLIAQKNNLQMRMLNISAYQRNLISNIPFCGNLEQANKLDTAISLENVGNSAQLMAINAELEALNDSGSKLNYMA